MVSTVELNVMTFEQIENVLRATKSEAEALACRKAIENAFTEREKFRKELDEIAKAPPQPAIFNLDKPDTRAAIMKALAATGPKMTAEIPAPEMSLQFDGGQVIKRSVVIHGCEMTPDEAEAYCFEVFNMAQRARTA